MIFYTVLLIFIFTLKAQTKIKNGYTKQISNSIVTLRATTSTLEILFINEMYKDDVVRVKVRMYVCFTTLQSFINQGVQCVAHGRHR